MTHEHLANPTWILLHGIGDAPEGFEHLAGELQRLGVPYLVPDLVDLGSAVLTNGPYAHLTLAHLIASNLSQDAKTRPFVIVGHSMGVQIGIELVGLLDQVLGFVSLEGTLTSGDEKGLGAFLCTQGTHDGWDKLVEHQRKAPPGSGTPAGCLDRLLRTPPELFCAMAYVSVLNRASYAERFIRLHVPRLHIAGGNSQKKLLVQEQGADNTAGFELVVVEGAGHWVHVDKPVQVWDTIFNWYNGLSG